MTDSNVRRLHCSDHMSTARAGETQACADAAAERIAALEEAAEAAAAEHDGALAEAEVMPQTCIRCAAKGTLSDVCQVAATFSVPVRATSAGCIQVAAALNTDMPPMTGDAERCPGGCAGCSGGRHDGTDGPAGRL